MVNEDCARDLLQYLDSCLEISSTGKRVKPIKLKKVLHEEPLGNYTSDDIYNAAEYLVKLGLVNLPSRAAQHSRAEHVHMFLQVFRQKELNT